MFRRDGFLTLTDLRFQIDDSFEDILGEFREDENIGIRRQAWVSWIVRDIFESAGTLYLVHPEREPVPIDPVFVLWEDHSGAERPTSWPPLSGSSSEEIYAFQRALHSRWEFIDGDMGYIVATAGRISIWWLFSELKLTTNRRAMQKIGYHLKKFRGYFVCIREDEAMAEIQKLHDRFTGFKQVADAHDKSSEEKRKAGRPSKRAVFLAAYRRHWPTDDLAAKLTWKQRCKILENDVGQPVSPDTLQAALREENPDRTP